MKLGRCVVCEKIFEPEYDGQTTCTSCSQNSVQKVQRRPREFTEYIRRKLLEFRERGVKRVNLVEFITELADELYGGNIPKAYTALPQIVEVARDLNCTFSVGGVIFKTEEKTSVALFLGGGGA